MQHGLVKTVTTVVLKNVLKPRNPRTPRTCTNLKLEIRKKWSEPPINRGSNIEAGNVADTHWKTIIALLQ